VGTWVGGNKIFEANVATIQAEVPEPLVACGGLAPAGNLGSFGLSWSRSWPNGLAPT
jgi:hypothetical protein